MEHAVAAAGHRLLAASTTVADRLAGNVSAVVSAMFLIRLSVGTLSNSSLSKVSRCDGALRRNPRRFRFIG